MVSIVSISGLTVDLGNQRILDGVDLDVDAGEWITIIGPNGAGKTTMLRSLLGTVEHTGTI
ncbi:MAG: ATP-binding cassette domain-containing protein, partial [Acidimicrobiaceae bacterium]